MTSLLVTFFGFIFRILHVWVSNSFLQDAAIEVNGIKWCYLLKTKLYLAMASCSSTGTFFHVPSGPFNCRGGNENSLTVELPLRISFRTRNADSVPFIYTLSFCSMSASSLGIPISSSLFGVAVAVTEGLGAQPSSASATSAKAGCSFAGKRRSSVASHSLTSL